MLSLGPEEISSLVTKINGQNHETLGNIVSAFRGPKKERHRNSEETQKRKSNERFRICCIIATLLNDKVLTKTQRLVSHAILYDYSLQTKQGISQSHGKTKAVNIGLPFHHILIDMLEKVHSCESSAEKTFLFKLLSNPSTSYYDEISKKTPPQLMLDLSSEGSLHVDAAWTMASIRQLYMENLPSHAECSAGMVVVPTVSLPSQLANTSSGNGMDLFSLNYHALDEVSMFEVDSCSDMQWRAEDFAEESRVLGRLSMPEYNTAIKPCFMQWAPPMLEIQAEELQWMECDEGGDASLVWDNSFIKRERERELLKELLAAAFAGPLNPKQQQQLIGRIKMESNSLLTSEITSVQLPVLVENNSAVAVELVLQLINTKSDQMMDYLSALVNMDMSFHSIEVVNGLSVVTELPTEFIHLYVSNCISSCENMKDRFMQSRFVRLVCVLLQSLMRKNIVNIKDLFVELQAFCLTFSKVKEAILLFRLIKTLEGRA
jgi:hypothetical protein